MANHRWIVLGMARSLSGCLSVIAFLTWAAGPFVPALRSEQAQSQNAPNVSAQGIHVSVEVIVLDKKGNPVKSLKRDNFSIFEDGAQQQIATFEEVRDVPGETGTTARRVKTVLILFDGSNISPGRFALARDSAERYVQAHMRPQDLFAVAYYNKSLEMIQGFTGDSAKILDAIRQLGGSSGNPGTWSRQANQRVASLAVNRGLSESLVALNSEFARKEGRKAIIFYSEGSPSNYIDTSQSARGTALRANVAYYTIDTKALDTADRAGKAEVQSTPTADRRIADLDRVAQANNPSMPDYSMRVLGRETGGAALFNSSDFIGWLDKVDQELSNYYVLGFQSNNSRRGTKLRKLEVKTNLTGVIIKHREIESGP